MKRVYEFLRLPSTDQCLLVKSAFLLGTIRLGLKMLSFQILWRLLERVAREPTELHNTDNLSERIAWAVAVASQCIIGATCLTQALAAQVLFRRRGYPSCLRIGVAKIEEARLDAHAWVESQGKIVIGGAEGMSRYTLLPLREGERP